jgi:hypothetical protein
MYTRAEWFEHLRKILLTGVPNMAEFSMDSSLGFKNVSQN